MTDDPVTRALTDPALTRRDLAVFGAARTVLHPDHPRPLKLAWVARNAGIYPPDASVSLRRLLRGGYLVRVGCCGRIRTFRLG